MYIAQGYFSLVALNFADTTPLDQSIAADLRRNHRYHIIHVVPYGPAPARYLRDLAIRAAVVTASRPPARGTMRQADRRRPPDASGLAWCLPRPPDDDEKYLYIQRNLPYLTTVILIGSVCLIVSQLRFETAGPGALRRSCSSPRLTSSTRPSACR